jgi:putative hemin transport protein
MTPLDETGSSLLADRYQTLVTETPQLRRRDAAARLGVPEAALLAAPLPGQTTRRLKPDWSGLFAAFPALGPVMVLTRNEHCVHEKTGPFEKVDVGPHVGIALGDLIDLRIFPARWGFGFAVTEVTEKFTRDSLQFFDKAGTAIFKLYAKPATDKAAWDKLVSEFADDAATDLNFEDVIPPKQPGPDEAIDVAGFRAAWDAMKDTHEFFGMLKKFGAEREQALRLAGVERARPVATDAIRPVLEGAAASGQSIMVFVGNPGMIQIHTGPVKKLVEMGPWYNVLDPGFNLHLSMPGIAASWIVRKPTTDGDVTSLELFDAEGQTIAMLFGARKPGQPEDPAWRALLATIPSLS